MQYLEPRTDVPAKDDWSTRLFLQETKQTAEVWIVSFIATVTFVVCFFLPMTSGNVAALVVLAFVVLINVVGPLLGLARARARRRGLLDQPWRRLPATVAENDDGPWDLLLVDGLVLKGSFYDLPEMVLHRQEVFLCGPDAEGWAMIRAAGSVTMRPAMVDTGEHRAKEQVDRPVSRPQDLVSGPWLRAAPWVVLALTVAVVGVLVALSVSPLAPTGLVAAALVAASLVDLPMLFATVRRQHAVERAVERSGAWTPVPIRLFPEQTGHYTAGVAELPGGAAMVRFPNPVADVIANVAATGVMWVAATHEDLLAVGVPGLNSLTHAVVLPHGVTQEGDPMSWFRRLRPQRLLGLPN